MNWWLFTFSKQEQKVTSVKSTFDLKSILQLKDLNYYESWMWVRFFTLPLETGIRSQVRNKTTKKLEDEKILSKKDAEKASQF